MRITHRVRLAQRVSAAGVLILLSAASATASTMGFTRQFDFPSAGDPTLHWIALPWRYQPEDVGTPEILDAEDLCADLGGSDTVEAVLRWDETSSTFVEHLCGAADPFPLSVGEGYGVRNVSGERILGAIAGTHDETHSYSIPPSGGSQLSWLSIPYHLRIPENHGSLTVDAEDLCRQIGSSDVLAIVRWNDEISAYEAYGCGSAFQVPFEIMRGDAYGVVNRSAQTIDWQPTHY